MRLDKYKNIRWVVLSFLAVAIFLLFIDVDKNWAVVLIVIAFLIGANAIDKKQKEYLNEKINELEKRIDKLEHK
jgi:L-asparagine transporter-like permease